MRLALNRLLDLLGFGDRTVEGKLARLLPFGLLMLLTFAFIPVTGAKPHEAPLLGAVGVMVFIAVATLLTRWDSWNPWLRFVPALGCLAVAALLRQAEGGAASAIGVLPLVPVLWAALYGTPRALLVSVAGVAAMFVAPIVLIGPPRYTPTDYARATLWSVGALLIGATVQRLVRTVHRQRQELERLALTDSLTDLPNHRAWREALERELATASRRGSRLALAMIDIDRLKTINDTRGHEAGSAAIRSSAHAWRDAVRTNDILARFGGDEFGLILVDAGAEEALQVAERVRAATPDPITCSIGVASWERLESARDLFIRADRALYQAKRQGRDRVTAAGADAEAGREMSVAAAIPY